MQDPNADTQWNDVLRQKGVIPQKEAEITEEDVIKLVDSAVQEKTGKGGKAKDELNLDELDELEDEEDERVLLEYRMKRIAEIKSTVSKSRFGDVREISAEDYVQQVNKAGDGIWVVLHLYKSGIPLCALINDFLNHLAPKFPTTKFLRSVATTCIPNYPDKNLPTIFIYKEGNLKNQFIGPEVFSGTNLKLDGIYGTLKQCTALATFQSTLSSLCSELTNLVTVLALEWILGETGAIKTDLEQDPRPKIKDVLFSSLKPNDDDSDENDW